MAPREGGHDRSWLMMVSSRPLPMGSWFKCEARKGTAIGGVAGAATGGTGGGGGGGGGAGAGGRAKRPMARWGSNAGPCPFVGIAAGG